MVAKQICIEFFDTEDTSIQNFGASFSDNIRGTYPTGFSDLCMVWHIWWDKTAPIPCAEASQASVLLRIGSNGQVAVTTGAVPSIQ